MILHKNPLNLSIDLDQPQIYEGPISDFQGNQKYEVP